MSHYRPLQLAAILSQPQPQIDLRIQEYERSTRAFITAVSAYTSRAIDEITRRKEEHAQLLKREAERRKAVEAEVTECKVKEIDLMKVLEHEQSERKDAEGVVAGLKRHLTSVKDKSAAIDVEIQQYVSNINSLRTEKLKERKTLQLHTSHVEQKIHELENRLKFSVEGVQKDLLLFRFTHIDPSDEQKVFSFVLDVSDPLYRVRTCNPDLTSLPALVTELNETRAFYTFIKRMRQAFVDSVSPNPVA